MNGTPWGSFQDLFCQIWHKFLLGLGAKTVRGAKSIRSSSGYWPVLSLLRRKGTTSSPQMVVWNKQNPLEEHLSHPVNEARSSSSSSSNQSEHGISRTGSSPLAVPGRRWGSWWHSIVHSELPWHLIFIHSHLSKFWMITGGTVLSLYQSLWPKTAAHALPMRKSLPLVLSNDTEYVEYVTVFFSSLFFCLLPLHLFKLSQPLRI